MNEEKTTEEELEVEPLLGVVYPSVQYPTDDELDKTVASMIDRWQGTLDLLAEHDKSYE